MLETWGEGNGSLLWKKALCWYAYLRGSGIMVFHHGKQTSNAKPRALHVGSGPAAMGQRSTTPSLSSTDWALGLRNNPSQDWGVWCSSWIESRIPLRGPTGQDLRWYIHLCAILLYAEPPYIYNYIYIYTRGVPPKEALKIQRPKCAWNTVNTTIFVENISCFLGATMCIYIYIYVYMYFNDFQCTSHTCKACVSPPWRCIANPSSFVFGDWPGVLFLGNFCYVCTCFFSKTLRRPRLHT